MALAALNPQNVARHFPKSHAPDVYLSTSEHKWRIIYQGLPICNDKATPFEAMRAADQCHVEVAPVAWNGDRSEWVWVSTIDGL